MVANPQRGFGSNLNLQMLVFERRRRKKEFPQKKLSQQERKARLKKLNHSEAMASLPAVKPGAGDIAGR